MSASALAEKHDADALIPEAHQRKRRRRTAIAIAALLLAACISGVVAIANHHHTARGPVAHPRSKPLPGSPEGFVRGYVAECAGPPEVRPRPATVRLLRKGTVVATAAVVAGDPLQDRFRLRVAPGRYSIEATNWKPYGRAVTVVANEVTTADFPNVCD